MSEQTRIPRSSIFKLFRWGRWQTNFSSQLRQRGPTDERDLPHWDGHQSPQRHVVWGRRRGHRDIWEGWGRFHNNQLVLGGFLLHAGAGYVGGGGVVCLDVFNPQQFSLSFSPVDQLRNSYQMGNDHSLRVVYANGMVTHYQTEPHILAGMLRYHGSVSSVQSNTSSYA